MRLTMQERKTVTKACSARYRRARKKEKGRLLDEFVESTDYNRVYAARVLRGHGRRVELSPGVVLEGSIRTKRKRVRECEYGPDVLKGLKKVWKLMDYICGKRLVAALPEVVPHLISKRKLKVSQEVRGKLMRIGASTIDRLLAPEREKHALKGHGQTKPGTLLKEQIPVRTFSQWDDAEPGFLEMDLVGHEGGLAAGEYCQTLDATDVATGWSEQIAVPTKAQSWVFEGIQEMRRRLPFDLLGLDSDNGAEFINHQLTKYCVEEEITFTRSRAGRKNDNCYVEQKNWSIVRRFVGYGRFEGDEACSTLNDLYEVVRDYVNFFTPSQKLKEKIRDGARVTKRYHPAQTPYRRLMDSPQVSKATKQRLKAYYDRLDLDALHQKIQRLQKKLNKLATRPATTAANKRKPSENHPWRRTARKKRT